MRYAIAARHGMWAACILLSTATSVISEVRVGAVGTHNTSDMSRAGSESPFWYSSWGGGVALEVDVTDRLALLSRPMYLGKGSGRRLVLLPGETSREMRLRYFEIPLLVKWSAPGKVAPYLVAGPTLGLRWSAESLHEDYGDDQPTVEDGTDDTEPVELGLEAGVGVGVKAGRAYGFFEGVWTMGLTNVDPVFGKNRGLQLRLGLALRLGSR